MEPKRDIRIGDTVLRRQPPVVGVYCSPPTSTKSTREACCYDNVTCSAGSKICPTCLFPYCDNHYPRHQRTFECPVDIWLEFDRRRRHWYDVVKANPKARPKVDVRFPEVPHGQV